VALRRRLLVDTFTSIHRAHATIAVAFTPEHARDEVAALFDSQVVTLIAQQGTDLGSRMHAAINDRLAAGATHVVLIGSDLPNLPPAHVEAAFVELEAGRDLVLGPAEDGGYYLIGMRRPQPAIFSGIDWGTPGVLKQTLAAAARAGLDVALIEPWYDVDQPDDLRRARSESGRANPRVGS
jgi:uncharacterized protein